MLACLISAAPLSAQEDDDSYDEETRRCVSTRTIRKTYVVDDRNLLFYMGGRSVLHNVTRQSCTGLQHQGKFSYNTSFGVLCEGDGIARFGDDPWGTVRPVPICKLGVFHQISREEADEMRSPKIPNPNIAPRPMPMPEPSEIGTDNDKTKTGEAENQWLGAEEKPEVRPGKTR